MKDCNFWVHLQSLGTSRAQVLYLKLHWLYKSACVSQMYVCMYMNCSDGKGPAGTWGRTALPRTQLTHPVGWTGKSSSFFKNSTLIYRFQYSVQEKDLLGMLPQSCPSLMRFPGLQSFHLLINTGTRAVRTFSCKRFTAIRMGSRTVPNHFNRSCWEGLSREPGLRLPVLLSARRFWRIQKLVHPLPFWLVLIKHMWICVHV